MIRHRFTVAKMNRVSSSEHWSSEKQSQSALGTLAATRSHSTLLAAEPYRILVLTCTLYERKRDQSFLVFLFFLLFVFWIMILEQAALTHDIERIFRSKKSEKTFQNDEGAKQHMAPSTSQAAWTFATV